MFRNVLTHKLLAMTLGLMLPVAAANAGFIVTTQEVTVNQAASGDTIGQVDVVATFDSTGSDQVDGISLLMNLTPGLSLTGFTEIAPFNTPQFPSNLTPGTNSATFSYFGSSSGTVGTDTVLVRFDFAVTEGFTGDFNIAFDEGVSALSASFVNVPTTFETGTISVEANVIPEPASLALLMAGGMMIASRRRHAAA